MNKRPYKLLKADTIEHIPLYKLSIREQVTIYAKTHDYFTSAQICKDLKLKKKTVDYFLMEKYRHGEMNRDSCACGQGYVYRRLNN